MKILIAGGREYSNYKVFKSTVEKILVQLQYESCYDKVIERKDFEIVQGGAKGVDSLAAKFSIEELGKKSTEFLADWQNVNVKDVFIKYRDGKPYNANAGFQRNQKMVEYVQPDGIAIYFWNGESPGTKDCIKQAKKAGIRHFVATI